MAASSNLIQVAVIEESTYGTTPGAGNFSTVRFTSESLSGSPDTVESATIRTDRMSSGQIVTGLQVQGSVEFELAKDTVTDAFLESAMYSTWVEDTPVTVDLTYTSGTGVLTRASGSFITDGVVVGDVLTLAGFVATENNTQVMVTEVTDATNLVIVGPSDLTTEAGSGTSFEIADKLTIGTTKKSFSLERKYTDLTNKGLVYTGSIAGEASVNVAYGELVTGSFNFMGNGYVQADEAAELITDGRTVDAAGTTSSLNGSVDMPFITTNATGSYTTSGLNIRSLNISINNNLSAITAVGAIAPRDYSAGTCNIGVEMTAYLDDTSYALTTSKLTQTPFAIGFVVKNSGGFYGFYMPRVQVTMDDSAAGGQNQDLLIEMSGTASVGSSGESALYIFKG